MLVWVGERVAEAWFPGTGTLFDLAYCLSHFCCEDTDEGSGSTGGMLLV